MLKDGILLAEQFVIQLLMRSCDLALAGLDTEGDDCRVNHAEERPILLPVPG